MNHHQDQVQTEQNTDINKAQIESTFETQNSKNSKNDRQIEQSDEQFKIQRKKYLQQRLNSKKQAKKQIQLQCDSSSSQSQDQIINNNQTPVLSKNASLKPFQLPVEVNLPSVQLPCHTEQIPQNSLPKQQQISQPKQQQALFSDQQQKFMKPNYLNMKLPTEEKSSKSSSFQTQNNPEKREKVIFYRPHSPAYSLKSCVSSTRRLCVLVQSKKTLKWVEQTLLIENKKLRFLNQNLSFYINFITKLKIYRQGVDGHKNFAKVKFTYNDDDYIFAASTQATDGLEPAYLLLSRIIHDKLALIGVDFKPTSAFLPNCQSLKNIPSSLNDSALIFGNIRKKSQFLGNWETRFISLTNNGIQSAKKPNEKPSMNIFSNDISEIWTRFDLQGQDSLNLKIMYDSTKTEFGIPLNNFADKQNWLYCFYKVMMQGQNDK